MGFPDCDPPANDLPLPLPTIIANHTVTRNCTVCEAELVAWRRAVDAGNASEIEDDASAGRAAAAALSRDEEASDALGLGMASAGGCRGPVHVPGTLSERGLHLKGLRAFLSSLGRLAGPGLSCPHLLSCPDLLLAARACFRRQTQARDPTSFIVLHIPSTAPTKISHADEAYIAVGHLVGVTISSCYCDGRTIYRTVGLPPLPGCPRF